MSKLQMVVFTSTKTMSKFCSVDIRKHLEFQLYVRFSRGGVRRVYGIAAVFESTRHCREDRHKSTKMQQHHCVLTSSQQPVSRLAHAVSIRIGLVSVAEAGILGPSALVQGVLMSLLTCLALVCFSHCRPCSVIVKQGIRHGVHNTWDIYFLIP